MKLLSRSRYRAVIRLHLVVFAFEVMYVIDRLWRWCRRLHVRDQILIAELPYEEEKGVVDLSSRSST